MIETESENITAEQPIQFNAFLQKCRDVMRKQIASCVIVLIFDDVVNHQRNSSHLVCTQSPVNSCPIEILIF